MSSGTPLPTPASVLYRRDLYMREIRLALIYNGKWQDPISCVFKYTKIESHAPLSYSALSYVWGSSRAAETIQIDGHDHNISINLACAIRHLRDERNSVLIWIDALCINQSDVVERSFQVAMMRDIYASAQHVIVFLGHGSYHRIPKNYSTDRLLAPIQFTNDNRDDSLITRFHNSWETMCRRAEWYSFCTICVIRALSDLDRYSATIKCIADGKASSRLKLFELVRRFINGQWWQRVWVIQEATVTSQVFVQYGNVKVPWEVLAQSANTCDSLGWGRQDTGSELFLGIEREHAKVLPVFSKQIFEIERLRMEWDDGKITTLLSLLQEFSSRKATDDRDKVFALLGLAGDITIKPDYSLSTVQVYRSTVIDLIKHSGSLTALSGDMKRKNSGHIPSWIPDWSVAMEEPDRRRMQLDGAYRAFPRWRIVLIDREVEYWEAVTRDLHSLYEEIGSGKRRPIPKEIVDGLLSYERMLTTIYGSELMDIESLDPPKKQAIDQCGSLYWKLENVGPHFWSRTRIAELIGAYLSLPPIPSSGELYRLEILRCCSMIYCRKALDLWLKEVQYLERERYKTNLLLISDQEKENIVAKHYEHPTIETITSRDAAQKWIQDMHRTFYTVTEHITDKTFAEICRSRSIMQEAVWSLTVEATVALEKDRTLGYSMTFDYDQGTPTSGGLLNLLSHLMHVASEVLSLWTRPVVLTQAVQQAKDACKGLIDLHRNKDLSTIDHEYATLFSKAVVFTGSATWMRHLRDNGQPKAALYDEHFLEFRSQKQHEAFRESKDIFHISSEFIATVGQCTERLLTWVDSASRMFTISQWALCAQNLKEPDFAVSFVRALVGDIYEESLGKFRRLRQPEIRLLQNWFVSCLLPQLCDMNPAVHGKLWMNLLSTELELGAELDEMKSFDTEMRLNTEGRVFFITTDHRMGFGPGSMVDGDEIRFLAGGNNPFVLRPMDRIGINSEPSYEVIGDCFCLLESKEEDKDESGLLKGCLPVEILGELLPTAPKPNDILLL
ncbi:related to heterokaryon incompatibility protein (het-6OR allele) [Fusarium fujikuroi IMI 58289]|uniref:Related to heterokaryon incompatibility protein (Het-6OR allele) n=1 Tax=Gibberella fujikuroi (strain CBS 195.34 / IMI 58289 / NRRL A-6831) TaxID=1279085 RepID=S0E7E2_GIBF5|nr:related to heterokaryon incompatibility protein (het-6OR allele) [Fusarium fujikuroi IMI 58289]CCT70550.1 related to heterokaryon incompatibility protein (het-6OR allele) [Fusarium fujikuroi IMI 58289]SCN83601.1 related to heterokaryon incompatibility protein (het-6OR allele) [Fusarium fujikuroi]